MASAAHFGWKNIDKSLFATGNDLGEHHSQVTP
jgi:hypothetical protein